MTVWPKIVNTRNLYNKISCRAAVTYREPINNLTDYGFKIDPKLKSITEANPLLIPIPELDTVAIYPEAILP